MPDSAVNVAVVAIAGAIEERSLGRPIKELVEEPVARTPPHLEPIVPDLGNRLKIKRFTCVWSHVRISVWYVLTIGSGLALMNRVNCSQSRDFR